MRSMSAGAPTDQAAGVSFGAATRERDASVERALHDAVLALVAGLSAAVGATWQSIIASSCVGRAPSMSAGEPTDQDGVRYRRRIRATLELGVFPPDCSVAPLLPWVRFVPLSSTFCVVTLPNITPLR